MEVFEYEVNGELLSTQEHILKARQILINAKLDPTTYYLVEIEGHNQTSFKDKPEEPIHMHEHMKFISIFSGPTTVS